MTRLAVAVCALALAWLSMQPAQGAEHARGGQWQAISGTKAEIVPHWTQHINAGFYDVNCDVWGFQANCQHFGTDVGGNGEGTPVYAPVGGWYTGCQDNGDEGPTRGKWIEYTADDGAALLLNHFRDSPYCGAAPRTRIEAGSFLGTMRMDTNHIHVQVSQGGVLVDFEEYWGDL